MPIILLVYTEKEKNKLNNGGNDMRSLRKMLSILLILSVIATIVPVALAVNDTATPTATATVTTTVTATVTPEPTQGKFRVGPTVKLRPVNDVINSSADGLVELYMDNPSLNDITLNVDARISVPSGIHVYGQGFGEATAAGTVYGTFSVPPGSARTIYLNIKAEKTGEFTAQFSGLYWPGDNKDAYQPISLTHPFTVVEASPNPQSSDPTNAEQVPGKKGFESWWIIALIVVLAIVAIVALSRKSQ